LKISIYNNFFIFVGLENVAKKFADRKSWAKISPFIDQNEKKRQSDYIPTFEEHGEACPDNIMGKL